VSIKQLRSYDVVNPYIILKGRFFMPALCSSIKFKLTFDKPGVYEYTMEELTKSGEGWETDDKKFKVIVKVEDDGKGKLVATVEYPNGEPEFENKYKTEPVEVVIEAKKSAIGAELPCEKFEFGLFDEEGELVATAKNKADNDHIDDDE